MRMETRTAAEQQEVLLDNNVENDSSEVEREKLEMEQAELEASVVHLKNTHQPPTEGHHFLDTYNPADEQYDIFLNFKDKSLEKEYLFSCKRSLLKWSTIVGSMLLTFIYYCRMPLHPEVFRPGNEAHVVSLCTLIVGTLFLVLVQSSHAYVQALRQGSWLNFCSWVICESGTTLTQPNLTQRTLL